MPATEPDPLAGFDACPGDLNALVMMLRETAWVEGVMLRVEWLDDGSVVLQYDEFYQHMWCQDGEMHIDCRDPAAP